MIRKAIIVVLTLGAVGTGVVAILSYICWPEGWSWDTGYHGFALYHVGCTWFVGTSQHDFQIHAHDGTLHLSYSYYVNSQAPGTSGRRWKFPGFSYKELHGGYGYRTAVAELSLVLIALLSSVYPTTVFICGPLRIWRRWCRRRKG